MRLLYSAVVTILWLAISFLSISQVPIQAQDEEKTSKVRDELVSFDVREQSFDQLIEGIREQTGKNIIYDEEIKEIFITIKLSNVPWLRALEIIAKEYKCLVEDLGQVVKVSKPPTVTMEFEGAEIRDIINQIATIANKNIVISEQVKGSISLRLKDVPWQDALEAIIKTRGYVIVKEKDGRILRVVPPEEIEADLETKIFKLRFIRPKSVYIAKMKSDYFTATKEDLSAGKTQSVEVSRFSLLNALEAVVSQKRGKITYDDATNTLVITDVKPKIDKMAEIIRELDQEPKQVFIDIKFIRTTNSDIFDFGMGPGTDDGIRISQSFGSMATRLPFTLGRGGWEDAIAAVPKETLEKDGFPSDDLLKEIESPVTFGKMDFSKTEFTLRLMKKDTKTKVIQAPKIITLDHHEATIFVGKSVSYADTKIQNGEAGQSTVEVQEAGKSPAKEGFQVLVVPHVIPGTNKVQLTVIPSNDQLTGSTSPLIGFNRFQASGGTNQITIDLPELTQQAVVTHMILESGQTAVLGGLLKISQRETVRKVPFFGDIPLFGYFFKQKSVSKEKEDMYIFITPRIVQSAEDTQEKIKATLQSKGTKNKSKYQAIWQQDTKTKDTK